MVRFIPRLNIISHYARAHVSRMRIMYLRYALHAFYFVADTMMQFLGIFGHITWYFSGINSQNVAEPKVHSVQIAHPTYVIINFLRKLQIT